MKISNLVCDNFLWVYESDFDTPLHIRNSTLFGKLSLTLLWPLAFSFCLRCLMIFFATSTSGYQPKPNLVDFESCLLMYLPTSGIIKAMAGHGFSSIACLAISVILSLGLVCESVLTPKAEERITSIVTPCCQLKKIIA